MSILKTCPVEILQDEWEFEQLLSIYKTLQPENVLEIGSFYGGTLWFWLNNSSKLKRVLSIDWPVPKSDGRYEQMIESKAKWEDWVKDIEFKYIKGDSTHDETINEAYLFFNKPLVDFLFIDGGHDYKTVKSDFENYSVLVKPGGIIVLHDVIGLGEVNQYWKELKTSGKKYLEICNNSTVGWGIGIIYI